MAMTQLELNTVSRGLQAAKKVLDELKPTLDSLNVIYDSEGGAKTQLDDGMFALTATIKSAISNAYSQLAELAARA